MSRPTVRHSRQPSAILCVGSDVSEAAADICAKYRYRSDSVY